MTRRPGPARVVDMLYAVNVAGYRIAVRRGRVWLHRVDDRADGDLSPAAAKALAAALEGAARRAAKGTDP